MTESFTGHCDENQSVPSFNITGRNTKFDGYGNNHILGIGIWIQWSRSAPDVFIFHISYSNWYVSTANYECENLSYDSDGYTHEGFEGSSNRTLGQIRFATWFENPTYFDYITIGY